MISSSSATGLEYLKGKTEKNANIDYYSPANFNLDDIFKNFDKEKAQ